MVRTVRTVLAPAVAAVLAAGALYAPDATACVAGIVTAEGSTVTADSQLALVSIRRPGAGVVTTDVVVLLNVPAADADFGALIPLPANGEPTIDPVAVDAVAFADLEANTRPVFEDLSNSGGGGGGFLSCGAEALAGDAAPSRGVVAGPTVDIGPVTAQWLVANDATALIAYLDDNGFALPPGGADVVDGYIAAGNGFLAFKRNLAEGVEGSAAGPVSLGVHFNAPGDLRTLPLVIASLGAPEVLPFTVFVANAEPVGAELPWRAVDVADLDDAAAIADYAGLIDTLTADADGKLFILETVTAKEAQGSALMAFVDDGAVVSRLSARIPRTALDADVSFTAPAPAPTSPATASLLALPKHVDGAVLALLGITLAVRRKRSAR